MIKLEAAKMTNAIEKAKAVKPLVRPAGFRSYLVMNKQTGAAYEVQFTKQGREKLGSCTCKAGERGYYCYHLAAAASIHIQIAAERAALNY